MCFEIKVDAIHYLLIMFFLYFQCYYLGGLDESATGILGELSKPVSWGMPAEKVCERLKKRDAQVCDLRYGKFIYSVK